MFCLGLYIRQHTSLSWLDENQAFRENLCQWQIMDISEEASELSWQYLSLIELFMED